MSETEVQTAKNLTQRPFAERQLLVVSTSEALAAVGKNETEKSNKKDGSGSWTDAALGAINFVGGWQGSIGKILGAASVEVFKALRKAWEKGLPIQAISLDEAMALDFPPGHPRLDTVYACHPASPTTYYPLADFHRVAFEGKFAEAMTLLMALGAESLRVEHVTGWSTDFAAGVSATIVPNQTPLTGEATKSREKSNSILFEASLTGLHPPQLPDHLVWYQHEPTWKSIATGRLNYGLDAFRLGVSYRDNYGVDAKLAASIEASGLGIGGKFESHQSTVWQIEGRFQKPR